MLLPTHVQPLYDITLRLQFCLFQLHFLIDVRATHKLCGINLFCVFEKPFEDFSRFFIAFVPIVIAYAKIVLGFNLALFCSLTYSKI